MGILKRAIAKDASVVASAVDATDIVAEIERIHKTSAVVTAALGRLSIAACMMGYDLKNEKGYSDAPRKRRRSCRNAGRRGRQSRQCKSGRGSAGCGTSAECERKAGCRRRSGNRRYTFCCERSGHERTLCGRCSAGFRRDCRGRGAVLRYQ